MMWIFYSMFQKMNIYRKVWIFLSRYQNFNQNRLCRNLVTLRNRWGKFIFLILILLPHSTYKSCVFRENFSKILCEHRCVYETWNESFILKRIFSLSKNWIQFFLVLFACKNQIHIFSVFLACKNSIDVVLVLFNLIEKTTVDPPPKDESLTTLFFGSYVRPYGGESVLLYFLKEFFLLYIDNFLVILCTFQVSINVVSLTMYFGTAL